MTKKLLGRKFAHNLVKIDVKDQQQEKFTICDLYYPSHEIFKDQDVSHVVFRTTPCFLILKERELLFTSTTQDIKLKFFNKKIYWYLMIKFISM